MLPCIRYDPNELMPKKWSTYKSNDEIRDMICLTHSFKTLTRRIDPQVFAQSRSQSLFLIDNGDPGNEVAVRHAGAAKGSGSLCSEVSPRGSNHKMKIRGPVFRISIEMVNF